MIKTESLIYKIDQKLNKLSSNAHQQIPLEDKILQIREGQISLIKSKLNQNNVYHLGFESFKKRYQDLQVFIEDYKDHELTLALTNPHLNEWSVDISELSPKYMFYVDSYILASKGGCKDIRIDVNTEVTKHGDIPTILNNSNYRPSFEYRETFLTIASNRISVYTDGTFTPSKLYLCYLRYPKEVDYPGYIRFDGSDSELQDCELEDYLEDELLDIVVEKLAMYTENASAVAYAERRKQENE